MLDAMVVDRGGADTTLGEVLDARPTLLVFLRHFG